MDFHQILPIIMERFNAGNTLWALYITVVIGMLAYLAATAATSSSRVVRLLLTVGFLAFAFVNHSALSKVRDQSDELVKIASSQLPSKDAESWRVLLESATPTSKRRLAAYHIGFDGLVVIVIWLMPTLIRTLRK